MNRPTRALAAALVSAGMLATAPTLAHAAPQRGEAVRPVIGGTSTLARATPDGADADDHSPAGGVLRYQGGSSG